MTTGGTALIERVSMAAAASLERESGALALALMSDEDFEARIRILKTAQERVARIQRELMTEGVDYGLIPGTDKPALMKPGAEHLCKFTNVVPSFQETWIEGDGMTRPTLRVRIACHLHLGTAEGPIVGEGGGAANSWEKKHRYRLAQRECPACGVAAIRRSKYDDRGWYCWEKAGGCGEKFAPDEAGIAEQEVGMVDNPDPYDAENTLLKMAMKRAQVDATLRYTATSGLFSQDTEEEAEEGAEGEKKKADAKGPKKDRQARQEAPRAAGRASAQAQTPKEAPKEEPRHQGGHIGRIKNISLRQAGGDSFYEVSLNTGFTCGTRDEGLALQAEDCKVAGALVELVCDPARGQGNRPKLREVKQAALGE